MTYKTIVSCVLDRVRRYFEFDALKTKSVSGSSVLTTYPIVSKDVIADHMYREPMNVDINADFSLNGHKGQGFDTPANRLGYIEDIFERIKDEGILCDIYTIKGSFENGDFRFKQRNNMALTSFTFDENYNSFSARLSFREVMTIDVDETLYEVDVTDPTLPALTDPATLDFTDTFIDEDTLVKMILDIMYDKGLVTQEFLNHLAPAVAQIAGGVLGAVAIGALVTVLAAISVTGVGLIFVGIVAAGALIGIGLKNMFDAIFHQVDFKAKKQMVFDYYNDENKDKDTQTKFVTFINEVKTHVEQLEKVMKVLGIGSDEPQELCTYIDNEYYLFTFSKNENGSYRLNVTDINNNTVNKYSQTELQFNDSIDKCTEGNYLFRTTVTGRFVYLMYKQTTETEDTHNLMNYCILVSAIDLKDYNDMLMDILKEAIIKW